MQMHPKTLYVNSLQLPPKNPIHCRNVTHVGSTSNSVVHSSTRHEFRARNSLLTWNCSWDFQ